MMNLANYQLVESSQEIGNLTGLKIETGIYIKNKILPKHRRIQNIGQAPSMANIQNSRNLLCNRTDLDIITTKINDDKAK